MMDLPEYPKPKTLFGSITSWFKGNPPSYGKKTPINLSRSDEEMIKLNKIPNGRSAVKHSPASRRNSKPGSTPKKITSSQSPSASSSKSRSKTRKSLSADERVALFFNHPKPVTKDDNSALVNRLLLRPEKKADFIRKAILQFIPSWLKSGASTRPELLHDKKCYHYADFFNEAEVGAIIRDARKRATNEIPRPAASAGAEVMKAYIKKVTALVAAISFKAAYSDMCDNTKLSLTECDKDACFLAEATNIARMAAFKVARDLYTSVRHHSR
jgi:hypothetical protein